MACRGCVGVFRISRQREGVFSGFRSTARYARTVTMSVDAHCEADLTSGPPDTSRLQRVLVKVH